MSSPATAWDGKSLEAGPIALATLQADAGNDSLTVMAMSSSRQEVVSIALDQFTPFLLRHTDNQLVCLDVVALHSRITQVLEISGDNNARAVLCAFHRESKFVDLRLLDRIVRYSKSHNDFGLRSVEELLADVQGCDEKLYGKVRVRDEKSLDPYRLSATLRLFAQLSGEIKALVAEVQLPQTPVYRRAPLSLDEAERMQRLQEQAFRNAVERRRQKGVATAAREEQATQEPIEADRATDAIRSPFEQKIESRLLGSGAELQGAIAFAAISETNLSRPGLLIDSERLPAFRQRVEKQYLCASEVLAEKSHVKECFKWDRGKVALTKGGYPEFDKKNLPAWLKEEANVLCDAMNRPAPIPLNEKGQPSSNPERWGVWAACTKSLSAWRRLFRMAELGRLADSGGPIRPRYELLPTLRSMESNLLAYRGLGIPVFRPCEGKIFVAGRVMDLRVRSLAAVAVQRGYVARNTARLFQYLLRKDDPLAVAAGELYEAFAAQQGGDEERMKARQRFEQGRHEDTKEYRNLRNLTNALLETAPLGLPSSLANVFLHSEYGWGELTEANVIQLHSLLATEVAYELNAFREDATVDLVGARLGLFAQECIEQFINRKHPHTSGAALGKRIREGGSRPRILSSTEKADVSVADPNQVVPQVQSRKDLVECRGWTLGGRLTPRGSQAVVKQREVLLGADEVMMAVAFDLLADGYQLLGVAGDEFVVEIPVDEAEREQQRIKEIAYTATRRILVELGAPVWSSLTDEW